MYNGRFVPWDKYPKFLTFEEVQDPFSVLVEYFDGTWPTEQRKELKEWRKFVTTRKHYTHRHGPGNLLFIYDEHMRLLEACYLLSQMRSGSWCRNKELLNPGQLEEARLQWSYYPESLSEEEQRNPYRALKKVFRKCSLSKYREQFHEWLHAALYNNHIDETRTAGQVLMVYRQMKRLAAAAWMIRQLEAVEPKLKPLTQEPEAIETNVDIRIKHFDSKLSPAEKMGAEEVVAIILKALPSVRSVICLGTYSEPFTYYLLVMVDDACKAPEHELVNKIEDNCRLLTGVYAIVHKVSTVAAGLKKGGRFWTMAVEKGVILYTAPELILPEAKQFSTEAKCLRMKAHWERWGKLGKDFYLGAEHYLEKRNYKLAIFMLHQAAECTLIGVINVLTGYRQSVHNLKKLLQLTLLSTNDLMAIFNCSAQDSDALDLLCEAYSGARYKEGFAPDADLVRLANEQVKTLIARSAVICEKLIAEPSI